MIRRGFWCSQRVFLTGHTGFKGSWLTVWLGRLGAKVFGFALPPDQTPNLYSQLEPFSDASSVIGDVSNLSELRAAVFRANPTVAIHMAAQPLVRRSYAQPVETFGVNSLGTAHVLEALRDAPDLRAILVITTDKVYQNREDARNFAESDPLGGHDPYSASKAAAELITTSYAQSFFEPAQKPVATARAGNVVGGGDWSEDRLVPDVWRAVHSGRPLVLRYPHATRPWQHVLDPLNGYLTFVEQLVSHPDRTPRALNFGPTEADRGITVARVAEIVAHGLGGSTAWIPAHAPQPPEMKNLALDANKAMRTIGWRPRLDTREALGWTVDWYRRFKAGEQARDLVTEQIARYESMAGPAEHGDLVPDAMYELPQKAQ
jgi:CDP-glucose 4,6-dehydratase